MKRAIQMALIFGVLISNVFAFTSSEDREQLLTIMEKAARAG